MKYIASSAIIIRASDNKVLVGRRSLTKNFGAGLWETIGGSLEVGEVLEECIRREIKEELGTKVKSLIEFKDYQLNDGLVKVYIVTLTTEPKNNGDFEQLLWISEAELDDKVFVLNCKERIEDYFSSEKSSN